MGADDEIREYTLTCAYGIVSCIDQTNDNDTVGNVEAQAEISKQFMQSSSIPIFNRMEWLRRNKNIINLSNQNIKFQFSNEILNSLRELGGEKNLMGIDFKDKPRYLAFIHRFMYIMVGVGMTALYAYLSNL